MDDGRDGHLLPPSSTSIIHELLTIWPWAHRRPVSEPHSRLQSAVDRALPPSRALRISWPAPSTAIVSMSTRSVLSSTTKTRSRCRPETAASQPISCTDVGVRAANPRVLLTLRPQQSVSTGVAVTHPQPPKRVASARCATFTLLPTLSLTWPRTSADRLRRSTCDRPTPIPRLVRAGSRSPSRRR
jgi:hypothetical protein